LFGLTESEKIMNQISQWFMISLLGRFIFIFCVAFDWAMMLLHYLLMLGGILWYDYSEYGV